MNRKSSFASIDEYIASASPEVQPILEKIRQTIQAAIPDATETISYQMPAFKRRRIIIYFAAFKHHIGIYPPVKGGARLAGALLPYRGDKGNLRFPLKNPMPYELIGKVAIALSRENERGK